MNISCAWRRENWCTEMEKKEQIGGEWVHGGRSSWGRRSRSISWRRRRRKWRRRSGVNSGGEELVSCGGGGASGREGVEGVRDGSGRKEGNYKEGKRVSNA